jgi:predicted dehydrogenase
MRFALLGDHPDGLATAKSLASTGRHELIIYSGPAAGAQLLQRWDLTPRLVGDLEEALADPAVEMVVVAGGAAARPGQLRRALQSERHVLCVHPADDSPDVAYEAAMIQADTGRVLLPLLLSPLHPALARVRELLGGNDSGGELVVELEVAGNEQVLLGADDPGSQPGIPDWDVLRSLAGDVAEVLGLGPEEEVSPKRPLFVGGRFAGGGLFHIVLLPNQTGPFWRLRARTARQRVELEFKQGWPGACTLSYPDSSGLACTAEWPAWDPWTAIVPWIEDALAGRPRTGLSWQDEIRCLELDDATRRSVARRRASTLEYQEATEEAGFKGTMTLVGCALLWASLLILILSAWIPWLAWVILPIFGFFLVLQVLRWALPPKQPGAVKTSARHENAGHEENVAAKG